MMKKLAIAALAAATLSAFAQTTHTSSTMQSSYDLNADNHWDRRVQVMKNLEFIGAGDAYHFEKMLSMAKGPEEFAIVKALYHVGGWANQLRWEAGMARVNQEWPTYAVNRTTVSTTATTDGAVTQTTTTTTTTTTPMVTQPMGTTVWDTQSDSARALRFVYEQPKPRIINYQRALEILGANLTSTEKGNLMHWWNDSADERMKDILVRLISRQTEWAAESLPPRIHYMESYRVR